MLATFVFTVLNDAQVLPGIQFSDSHCTQIKVQYR